MNFSAHLKTHGYLHLATIKRAYSLAPNQVTALSEPPPLVEAPVWEDQQLVADSDLHRKPHFTDIIVKGAIHSPNGQPVTALEAGIRVDSVFRQLTVTGQRHLELGRGEPTFSAPEPFTKIPMVWEEAYGGTDHHNQAMGDVWDLPKVGASMGKDLSFLNLCRYRRNPFGKGYVLALKPEHDGMLLPRIEFSHDRITPARLAVREPIRWHAMPSPACFHWQGYDSFPRMAFMGGKLIDGMDKQVPQMTMPEFEFGYTREDMFAKTEPDKLVQHPRFFNGAHPALQCPAPKRKTPVSLYHFDLEQPQFNFYLPHETPVLRLAPPGHKQTFKADGTLSHAVIDMNEKRLTMTWHAFVRTKLPVLPDYTDRIEWEIRW